MRFLMVFGSRFAGTGPLYRQQMSNVPTARETTEHPTVPRHRRLFQGYRQSTLRDELGPSESIGYIISGRLPSRFRYSAKYGAYVEDENVGGRRGGDGAAGTLRGALTGDLAQTLLRTGIGLAPGGPAVLTAYDAGSKLYGAAKNGPSATGADNGGDLARNAVRTGMGLVPGGNVALAAYDVGSRLYGKA